MKIDPLDTVRGTTMAAWLDLVSDAEGWSLVDTGRFDQILQGMCHPKTQYPSVIYFAGNCNRMRALRALFPRNNVTRKGPAGLARLHLSTSTANTENPIIFAESDLFTQNGLGDTKCLRTLAGNYRRFPVARTAGSRTLPEIQKEVIRRFILPWTHVFCLFVDSELELEIARDMLRESPWKLAVGNEVIPDLAHVIIILSQPGDGKMDEKVSEMRDEDTFQSRTVMLDLRDRAELSATVAFEPLRRQLLDEIQTAYSETRAKHLSFSAFHLRALWDQDIWSREQENVSGFRYLDCLSVARRDHLGATAMTSCFQEFLQQFEQLACPEDNVHEFLASALLMDAYPPGMHYFEPEMVFNALYRSHCLDAWRDSEPERHCRAVFAQFVHAFTKLSPKKLAAAVRADSLARFYRRWGGLHSTKACFFCMCRQPEHMMPCKHAICDTCVVIFGTASSCAEYHTDLFRCPICAKAFNLTIRRLPPTKGPVIFSLDGGGVRGIIQLGLIMALEKRLGGISIADVPDLCTGTSVGALTAMDIVLNGSSAEESLAKFPDFARMIFEPANQSTGLPIIRGITWIKNLVKVLTDSRYDSENLENTLKMAVDPQRRMFDVPTTKVAGCRVAIITSRTDDGKACVLANYRGLGWRKENGAYLFLAPRKEHENPFLWEAAECSVAAPFFFRTKSLPGFGTLQDGGVRANNPVAIALKESTVIWPSARKHDLLLSVGTGCSPPQPGLPDNPLRIIQGGALPRIIRAMMFSPTLDGHQGFCEALNYVPDHARADIFRLDHVVDSLPRLDDIDRLAEMSEMQFTVADDLVRATLASAFFFFELDEIPTNDHGVFYCHGSILCSRPNARAIVEHVLVEFPGAMFRTARGHYLGPVSEDDGCSECGYYRKKVVFSLNSLEDMFSIEISNSCCSQKIGGFPKSVQQLVQDQQVYAHFGRADHRVVSWPRKRTCYCSRGTKRLIHVVEPRLNEKKRRL